MHIVWGEIHTCRICCSRHVCISRLYKVLLHSHSMLIKDRREDIQNAQSQIRSLGYRCEYSGVQGLCSTLKQQQLRVLSGCGSSAKKVAKQHSVTHPAKQSRRTANWDINKADIQIYWKAALCSLHLSAAGTPLIACLCHQVNCRLAAACRMYSKKATSSKFARRSCRADTRNKWWGPW